MEEEGRKNEAYFEELEGKVKKYMLIDSIPIDNSREEDNIEIGKTIEEKRKIQEMTEKLITKKTEEEDIEEINEC